MTRSEIERQLQLDLSLPTILVAYHPVTIARDTVREADALFAALEKTDAQFLFCFPNADAGSHKLQQRTRAFLEHRIDGRIFTNLSPRTYWSLLAQVDLLLGNSSSGIMESASFALPTVNVGMRQQGRERARNVIDVDPDELEILRGYRTSSRPGIPRSAGRHGKSLRQRKRLPDHCSRPDHRASFGAAPHQASSTAAISPCTLSPGESMTAIRIPLSAPDITEAEIAAVVNVLRTPQLSLGPKLEAFERATADYVGANHAVAVNSGTSGLHLCIRCLGIGAGDEVIVPSFTFIAAANVIRMERATPVFVDIDSVDAQSRSRKSRSSDHAQNARHPRCPYIRSTRRHDCASRHSETPSPASD